MSRGQVILVTVIVIVAGVGGSLLARHTLERPMDRSSLTQAEMTAGTLIQPPRPIPSITLVDQDGQAFDTARFQGRWTLLFFGFTNCPDICPTTLGALKQISAQLTDLTPEQHPQIALVTVDPQRDTPAQLKAYLKAFSPSFLGITGSVEQTDAIAKAFSVAYAVSQATNGTYNVDHSGAIFLVNPQGAIHALFSTPHETAKIAADVRRIVS